MIRKAFEFSHLAIADDYYCIFSFIDDAEMARINRMALDHEGTTDVITCSYLSDGDSLFSGDTVLEVFISVETARRVGERRSRSSFSYELTLYIVHAILHARGYDDIDAGDRRRMRAAERRVMKKLRASFDLDALFSI